jgi:hypothetical protein
MKLKFWLIIGCFLVSGCITTQQQKNIEGVAGQQNNLLKQQIIENIIKLSDDPYDNLEHSNITKQTAETDIGITPQITSTFGAGIQTTVTNTGTNIQYNNAPLSLQAQANITWKNSSDLNPVMDSTILENLRTIYFYVWYGSDSDYKTLSNKCLKLKSNASDSTKAKCKYYDNFKPFIELLKEDCPQGYSAKDKCGLMIVFSANGNGHPYTDTKAVACDKGYTLLGGFDGKLLCASTEVNKEIDTRSGQYLKLGIKRFDDIVTTVIYLLQALPPKTPSPR